MGRNVSKWLCLHQLTINEDWHFVYIHLKTNLPYWSLYNSFALNLVQVYMDDIIHVDDTIFNHFHQIFLFCSLYTGNPHLLTAIRASNTTAKRYSHKVKRVMAPNLQCQFVCMGLLSESLLIIKHGIPWLWLVTSCQFSYCLCLSEASCESCEWWSCDHRTLWLMLLSTWIMITWLQGCCDGHNYEDQSWISFLQCWHNFEWWLNERSISKDYLYILIYTNIIRTWNFRVSKVASPVHKSKVLTNVG